MIPKWIRDAHRDLLEVTGGNHAHDSVYVGAAGIFNPHGYDVCLAMKTMTLDPKVYAALTATGMNYIAAEALAALLGPCYGGMVKTYEDTPDEEKINEARQAADEMMRSWMIVMLEVAGERFQHQVDRGDYGPLDPVVLAAVSQIIGAWLQVMKSAIQFKVPEMPE